MGDMLDWWDSLGGRRGTVEDMLSIGDEMIPLEHHNLEEIKLLSDLDEELLDISRDYRLIGTSNKDTKPNTTVASGIDELDLEEV